MTFYWQITADEEYLEQVKKLPLATMHQIEQVWIEVAKHEDPKEVGNTDDCGSSEEDCPFIVVIFPEITYEFIYEMDKADRILRLISCTRLTFLDHGQTE